VRKSSGAAPSPKTGKTVDRKVEKNTDATIDEIKQAVAEAA